MRRLAIAGALTVLCGAVALGDDLPAALDVNGRRGSDGRNGSNGSGSGASGGHAGASSPGAHAGDLLLHVQSTPDGDGFTVAGQRRAPRGHHAKPGPLKELSKTYRLGQAGTLKLRAHGGDGGRGGNGGNGSAGRSGSRGRDASCSRSGGRGKDGGNGGNGGNATSGSPGGDGGRVAVTLSATDTHLLLLLDPDVAPGRGGSAGRNGRGGAGGRGGRGGSRHSSHGKSCHGRSGGSNGRSGRTGRPGSANVHAGRDGAKGLYTIEIDGTKYFDRYRLRLTEFEIVSDNADGVIEPGEWVHVRALALTNTGDVPTPPPALHETRVYLPLTRNVSEPTPPILLPISLAKAEATVLTDALRFRVPDVEVGRAVTRNTRYTDSGVVDPRARLGDARRDHPEFPNAKPFAVGFPLGVRPLRIASAIGSGETQRFALEVENLSSKPFGTAVEDPKRRRAIQLALRLGGRSLSAEHVVFAVEGSGPVDLAAGPFSWPVERLDPGQTARLEVSLGIKPDAPLYSGADLDLNLSFGQIGKDPSDTRVIERRRLPLRVSARWRAPTGPALVLVTNTGVEGDAVAAWQSLAAGLGLELALWDVSYYGFLPLGARVADRSEALLSEAAKGQAVVILGNGFTSSVLGEDGHRQVAYASDLLSPTGLVRATHAGTGVLLVGGTGRTRLAAHKALDPRPSVADLLVPGRPEATLEHASAEALFAWLDAQGPDDDLELLHQVTTEGGWLWGYPRASDLDRLAADLADELAARWPGRRYLVEPRFRGGIDDGAFWNTYHYGTLEVRRSVDLARGHVTSLALGQERLSQPSIPQDPEVLHGLIRALPFSSKVSLLERYLTGELPRALPGSPTPASLGTALAAAIVADLSQELRAWTRGRSSGASTSGAYRERLTCHAQLAAIKLATPLDPSSERAACALQIAAELEFLGPTLWDASDVVVPFRAQRYYAVAAATGTYGDGLVDVFVDGVFGASPVELPPTVKAWPFSLQSDLEALPPFERSLPTQVADAQRAFEAARAERAASFQAALDALHAEAFTPEAMDRDD